MVGGVQENSGLCDIYMASSDLVLFINSFGLAQSSEYSTPLCLMSLEYIASLQDLSAGSGKS